MHVLCILYEMALTCYFKILIILVFYLFLYDYNLVLLIFLFLFLLTLISLNSMIFYVSDK